MARGAPKTTPIDFSKLIKSVPDAPPRAKAGKTQYSESVEGLEKYGALNRVKREIEDGFLETYGNPIKEAMWEYFISTGIDIGRTPANYKGEDGQVTASLQLRRKDTRAPLKADEAKLLDELEIPYDHVVDAPNTYRLKPEVFANQRPLLNEMMQCLHDNGYKVEELFEEQHEKARDVVAVNTTDHLFAIVKKARAAQDQVFDDVRVRELLGYCAGLSIRSDWGGTFEQAFEISRRILAPTPEEQAADAPKVAAKTAAAKDDLMAKMKASLAEVSEPVAEVAPARNGNGRGRVRA